MHWKKEGGPTIRKKGKKKKDVYMVNKIFTYVTVLFFALEGFFY